MSDIKIENKKSLQSKDVVHYGDDHAVNYQHILDLEKQGAAKTDQDAQQRVDILVNASNDNFAAASMLLGQWHFLGHYVEQNIESAVLFFKHAAKLGDALAMVELAHIGRQALSANVSAEEGLNYLQQALDLKHPEAIYASALNILQNDAEAALNLLLNNYQQHQHEMSLKTCIENLAFDPNVVIEQLENLAQNDHFASAVVAFQYFKQGNDKKAFKYAQKAQEHNDAYGCYVRALIEEKDPKGDPEVAYEFLGKAAQLGHIEACYWYGIETLRKAERAQDEAETLQLNQRACQFLQVAALHGDVAAKFYYGQCLRMGIGIEKNPDEGIQWLDQAAQQGNTDAQFELAMLLNPEDPRHVALLSAAAKNAHVQAMLCMAIYEQQKQQFGQAIQWLDLAQQAKSARASYLLARMYRAGQGVDVDLKHVVTLLQQAAEGGDVDAYFELYQAYSQGLGIRKNKKNAEKYLALAQQNQHIEACAIAL